MASDEVCKVLKHEDAASGYRVLELSAPGIAKAAEPGQFVHIKVPTLEESALRRPFSIFDADAATGVLTLLYKKVGRGTDALSKAAVGDEVAVAGPLGKGFPATCEGRALLVGGGYGVAPLYFLARRMVESGKAPSEITLFVGGRTKEDLLALERFGALGIDMQIATNDGSQGVAGFVTAPLDAVLGSLRGSARHFEFFCCGPDGLLKAICERAVSLGVPGWISVDRHMICGVGACYACIQKTLLGNMRCCVDGPIFKAEELVW